MLARKKNIKVIVFFTALFLIMSVANFTPALAQNLAAPGINYENINPNDPIKYQFKRLFEKLDEIRINIFFPNDRVKFITSLSNKRLAELVYVVDKHQLIFLERTSSRYITQLGTISSALDKNKADASFVKFDLENQINSLEKIKDAFPSQSAPWLLVRQAYDTANVLLSKATQLSK